MPMSPLTWRTRREWQQWHQPSASLWYWRNQGGNEVDLLMEQNSGLTAIECKLPQIPDKNRLGQLPTPPG